MLDDGSRIFRRENSLQFLPRSELTFARQGLVILRAFRPEKVGLTAFVARGFVALRGGTTRGGDIPVRGYI